MSLKRKANTNPTTDAKKPKVNGSITSFFGPPKTVSSTTKGNDTSTESKEAAPDAFKFNKEKWVASLTEEQKDLLKLEIDTLHESWLAVLKDEIVSKEFLDLKRFLKQEWEGDVKIFPPKEDVYAWYFLLNFILSSLLYTIGSHRTWSASS